MLTTSQHYTIEDSSSTVRFSFPYRKLWVFVFGLSGGVIAAIVISFLTLLDIFTPGNTSPLINTDILFLAICISLAIIGLVELLWLLIGREIVVITDSQIVVKHQIYGVGISKIFRTDDIDCVFVSHKKNDWLTYASRELKFFNFKKGMVAINSGKTIFGGVRTFRFGSILNEGEAKQIVAIIFQRFPKYKYCGSSRTG
jgi:hypothetical protein